MLCFLCSVFPRGGSEAVLVNLLKIISHAGVFFQAAEVSSLSVVPF